MTWRWWQFQYRNYVKLHKITDGEDQKCPLFDSLGVEAGEMLFSMCLPANPDDFTTAQIVDKLEHAFVKKINAATEWANYFKLKQELGESLLDYSNKLRRKAFPCGFPADVLEKNMSATFLNGLASDAVREHLQSKTYSTLEEALDIAENGPSIFQQIMERILQGCEGVAIYLDDIIVTGATDEEHLRNLERVLQRLEEHELRLKRSKCQFLQDSVEYLGFVVDSRGRHISRDRVKALLDMDRPANLLKTGVQWSWSKERESQFLAIKEEIVRATFLVHYDPEMPLVLAADASQYGVGAVLCHRFPDGTERPIAHASRALTGAEKNYGQIEKEALALADGLSRLPLNSTELDGLSGLGMDRVVNDVHGDNVSRLPVKAEEIAKATADDQDLSTVHGYILHGWPTTVNERLRPYKRLENELVLINNCICWGSRTVIPVQQRRQILDYLHEAHMGAVKMKGEARAYCWWPQMDKDIQQMSRECRICSERAKETAKAPLLQWEVPENPWMRLHMDFAGPYHGTMLLLVVDAMSKWPEVAQMKHATSDGVLETLRNLFSRYGACTEIVTDNGTQFTSQEFANFRAEHGIKHLRTPPGHPQSNGQAERYVQTIKDGVAKLMADRKNLSDALRQFLWRYRGAPYATTGKSPAELFLGRKFRTQLDLLSPVMFTHTERNRQRYQHNFDKRTKRKSFLPGDLVMVRDYRLNRTVDWTSGRLVRREGTRIWEVSVEGAIWRRHLNQIRPRYWLQPDERQVANSSVPATVVPPVNTGNNTPRDSSVVPDATQQTEQSATATSKQPAVTPKTELTVEPTVTEVTLPPSKPPKKRAIPPPKQEQPELRKTVRSNAGQRVTPRLIEDPNFGRYLSVVLSGFPHWGRCDAVR
ncbi:uncharacterized protein K02A2.6-like [Paramacrobiotus metropolitanus]|uniref:uncharacterized protein K02A2.6-like n=1 Tax=Paramacrobiotus metropolitanus TaxID=2943436 RepID=UPI0024457345|nr:uncharacterized protein K02A2.6-like [Paramacrobiotus metropolitanus]